ncbi:MAG: S41 family peptidase [Bacteroidetes bacterium]|nr:S41 family peptidase [Bacteroidota bacterium]
MNNKLKIILPIIFGVLLATGIFIGSKLNFSETRIHFLQPEKKSSDKLNSVLNFIEEEYVDTVKKNDLVEKAIVSMLQNLDPHSVYLTPQEVKEMREPLEGNFEGIGIEFNIIKDTIRVISVIAGGPSEALGIQAGDKIVRIEGKNAAGTKIKNKEVLGKLRGKGGTKVSISIMRGTSKKLIDYTITRGKIPIYSVDAGYMLSKKTGYIKVSRFAENTHEEFLEKASHLRSQGMENLILDLRGNGGGLLSSAIKICDEFLEKGKVIVFTEGKSHPKETIEATDKGILTDTKLIVLIDESSASASEIVAGAIQDNDRGRIIGRRSFGKGLVQRETMFADSSAIRLTVARYCTPTGRCIQKPYGKDLEDYYSEEYNRYQQGELMHADSIHQKDTLKYKTSQGKIVYGGGGITPDIFVSLDTTGRTPYLSELFVKGAFDQFGFDYADKNRKSLSKMDMKKFQSSFTIDENLFNEFITYSEKLGVKLNPHEAEISKTLIKNLLKASIARQIWGNDGFYPILNQDDKAISKAIEFFNKQ